MVVTGANGLVGARTCAALVERGARVRAVVRRAGAAPDGVEERVGEFADAEFAAELVDGADAVVTTVHPMAADRETQHAVGVVATSALARAAAQAGVDRFVHVSTGAVYDRSPEVGDVDESGALVADGAGVYPEVKRDTDAAIAAVPGLTRVLVRPPAILGASETSVWNTLRPAQVRDDEQQRHAVADKTFAWVHVDDLAAMLADVATGAVAGASDPASGPVEGECTAVNVAGEHCTEGRYYETVTGALGVEPVWDEEPAWTGRLLTDRARGWGWTPSVGIDDALDEVAAGLR